jgi:hypothetical protein
VCCSFALRVGYQLDHPSRVWNQIIASNVCFVVVRHILYMCIQACNLSPPIHILYGGFLYKWMLLPLNSCPPTLSYCS